MDTEAVDQDVSIIAEAASSEAWQVVEDGLREYSERPHPAAFVRVYTAVYSVFRTNCTYKQCKEHEFYRRYCEEVSGCVKRLRASLSERAHHVEPWHDLVQAVETWRSIRHRLYILQLAFVSLINRRGLPPSGLIVEEFSKVGIETLAQEWWRDFAAVVSAAGVNLSPQLVRRAVLAWHNLGPPVVPERVGAWNGFQILQGGVGPMLRAHIVNTCRQLAKSHKAVHRLFQDIELLKLIVEFLSDRSFCEIYGICSVV